MKFPGFVWYKVTFHLIGDEAEEISFVRITEDKGIAMIMEGRSHLVDLETWLHTEAFLKDFDDSQRIWEFVKVTSVSSGSAYSSFGILVAKMSVPKTFNIQ